MHFPRDFIFSILQFFLLSGKDLLYQKLIVYQKQAIIFFKSKTVCMSSLFIPVDARLIRPNILEGKKEYVFLTKDRGLSGGPEFEKFKF